MDSSLRDAVSVTSTIITIVALLFGAQSRLTSKLTPRHHEEQHRKTRDSQQELYTFLNISPRQCTRLIGWINLVLVAGLALPLMRKLTAGAIAIWLMVGAAGRHRTGRSIWPPLAIMAVVLGIIL